MIQDFSNKKWLRSSQPAKNSLKRSAFVVGTGLAGLLSAYFAVPQFREAVKSAPSFYNHVSTSLANRWKYNINPDLETITIPKGMTLHGYGSEHGLSGQSLRDWINAVICYNLAIKTDQNNIGIDEKGNLYAGKILNLVKP